MAATQAARDPLLSLERGSQGSVPHPGASARGRIALGSLPPAPQLGKPRRAPALMWRVPRPSTPRAGPKGSARPRGPRRKGGKVAGSRMTQPALSRYRAGRGRRLPAGLRCGCGGAWHRAPSPGPPVAPSCPPAARARSPLGHPLTRPSLPSPLPDGGLRDVTSARLSTANGKLQRAVGGALEELPGPAHPLAPPTSEARAGPSAFGGNRGTRFCLS